MRILHDSGLILERFTTHRKSRLSFGRSSSLGAGKSSSCGLNLVCLRLKGTTSMVAVWLEASVAVWVVQDRWAKLSVPSTSSLRFLISRRVVSKFVTWRSLNQRYVLQDVSTFVAVHFPTFHTGIYHHCTRRCIFLATAASKRAWPMLLFGTPSLCPDPTSHVHFALHHPSMTLELKANWFISLLQLQYPSLPWVRYITQSGDIAVRMPDVQGNDGVRNIR